MSAYYVSVEEVMVTWNLSRAYVYRLASERNWRRYRDEERRTHYRVEDVASTPGIGRKAA